MFAIIDIEATGGSTKTARIMEIAIVVHNGERVIEEYSTLVNPERKIDTFVVALTGISDEMVSDAPTFQEISEEILRLTQDRIIVAHNARFDYGFLKHEFKRLGQRFQRRNLCTVQMSQKLLPGHTSYSLGKLCRDLNIPVKNRHRALGDATATAVLLEKLLFSEKKHLVEEILQDELAAATLPAKITSEEVDNLPEEVGVYYFRNDKGQPIYIGKSKNIRTRILQHFSNDLHSSRFRALKEQVASIDYVLTGNELIAELMESGEIKRYMPEFNRAQKRKKYRYGLFLYEDENGYLHLKSRLLKQEEKPVLQFTTKRWAEKALVDIKKKNKLNQESRLKMPVDEYNEKLEEAIERFRFSKPNVLIIDQGRNYFEQSVIQIENGSYIGYGFFSTEEVAIDSPQDIISFIKKDYNDPNKEQIIRKYLRKAKNLKLIPYEPEVTV